MYSLTFGSKNRKTGSIPVSMSSRETCPDACPLKDGACYARFSFLGMHWAKLSEGKIGLTFDAFLIKIKEIPKNKLFRIGQAGDLPGVNNDIDAEKLDRLVSAAAHTRAWGYTHKPVGEGYEKNRAAIKKANEKITINLSADSLTEADELAALNIAPVVTTLPANAGTGTCYTPQGRKVIVCPAQLREDITCEKCQLCQKKRTVIVGFIAHGKAKNKIK